MYNTEQPETNWNTLKQPKSTFMNLKQPTQQTNENNLHNLKLPETKWKQFKMSLKQQNTTYATEQQPNTT